MISIIVGQFQVVFPKIAVLAIFCPTIIFSAIELIEIFKQLGHLENEKRKPQAVKEGKDGDVRSIAG